MGVEGLSVEFMFSQEAGLGSQEGGTRNRKVFRGKCELGGCSLAGSEEKWQAGTDA